jgi:hypothetical protein
LLQCNTIARLIPTTRVRPDFDEIRWCQRLMPRAALLRQFDLARPVMAFTSAWRNDEVGVNLPRWALDVVLVGKVGRRWAALVSYREVRQLIEDLP